MKRKSFIIFLIIIILITLGSLYYINSNSKIVNENVQIEDWEDIDSNEVILINTPNNNTQLVRDLGLDIEFTVDSKNYYDIEKDSSGLYWLGKEELNKNGVDIFDKSGNIKQQLNLKNIPSKIKSYGDIVVIATINNGGDRSIFYIYDTQLNLLNEIEVEGYPWDFIVEGDLIYMGIHNLQSDVGELYSYTISDGKQVYKKTLLKQLVPVNFVKEQDTIYISNYHLDDNTNGQLGILNLTTDNIKYIEVPKHPFILVNQDKNIYIYHYQVTRDTANSITKINKATLDLETVAINDSNILIEGQKNFYSLANDGNDINIELLNSNLEVVDSYIFKGDVPQFIVN